MVHQPVHRSELLRVICRSDSHGRRSKGVRAHLLFLAISFAISVTAIGCASDAPTSIKMSANDAPPSVIRLPLDAYLYSQERRFIEVARFTLLNRCAAELGLPQPYPPSSLSLDLPARARPDERKYGINSPVETARYGYHRPPDVDAYIAPALTDAEQRMLFDGSIPTSCESRSTVSIFGTREASKQALDGYFLVLKLANDAYAEAQTQENVVAAAGDWASCVRSLGFEAGSIGDPIGGAAVAKSLEEAIPAGVEIEAAGVDLECRTRSRYNATLYTADTSLQEERVDDNKSLLESLRKDLQLPLERASDVLGRKP